jgi:DNA ligase-associated metallophosphoesterase
MTRLSVDLAAITLTLLPECAIYWPEQNALLIADLHLGKAAAFRREGIAIPEGDTANTLTRLDNLLAAYQPERLILLGDILHSRLASDPMLEAQIRDWRDSQSALSVIAIIGNHDRDLVSLNDIFECYQQGGEYAGLRLCHHPPEGPQTQPWVAGHWHPVTSLRAGGDQLRLPAFIQTSNHGIVLPAFGSLTGGMPISRSAGQKRYPSSGERVFAID